MLEKGFAIKVTREHAVLYGFLGKGSLGTVE